MDQADNDFGVVSELLHGQYDHIPVTAELQRRVDSILRAGPGFADQDRPAARQSTSKSTRPVSRRRRRATFAVVAAVTVLVVGSIIVTHAVRSHLAQVLLPASLSGVSPTHACDLPNGPFARFYVFDRYGAGDAIHQGKVTVGAATVPSSSVYASHGEIGDGYLCLTNTAGPGGSSPVQAVLAAQRGAIAYLGLLNGSQPWGAVAPGITSVSIEAGGRPDVYTVDSSPEYMLRPLGAGWHEFNSPGGFSGHGPVALTVTAYAGTKVVDRKIISTTTPRSSAAMPATTR